MFLTRQIKVKPDDAAEGSGNRERTNLLENGFECRHRGIRATDLRNRI